MTRPMDAVERRLRPPSIPFSLIPASLSTPLHFLSLTLVTPNPHMWDCLDNII